jgi:3-hydroxybutyryl-CoA dehydrogenase
VRDAAFVFEAAPEKLPLKQQIFAELESLVAPGVILASNSSAIPTTEIARRLKMRERVVGTHFWNPPHLVPLVEVIQNEWTSAATVERTIALLAAGACDAETLDTVVKEGFGARMAVLGPLEQSDLVGLDLTLDISTVLVEHLDRSAGPHPFLVEKVKAGKLGMRTGEGFRRWTPEQAEAVRERLRTFLAEQARKPRR